MNKLSLAFFSVAPAYVLIGMGWGVYMGITEDHALMPAHAHLNLLGMVLNAVMGAFYGLAGERSGGKLGWASFWSFNLGVVIMIPTLVTILAGTGAPSNLQKGAMTLAEVLTLLGVLLFATNVWKLWKKTPA